MFKLSTVNTTHNYTATPQKVKFEGLNALRFFAAFFVLLHHCESIRAGRDMPNLRSFSLFQNGGLAVWFFFVLSGFLITYLLLSEIRRTHDVAVGKFLMRRVLRIWPLYFLIVVLGLAVVPFALQMLGIEANTHLSIWAVGGYYLLFLSFVVNTLFHTGMLEPLWSIGVEEYFYVLWAPLFKFFKKNALAIIVSMIAVKTLMLVYLEFDTTMKASLLGKIISVLRFELMAIGGLGAYFTFYHRARVERLWVFSPLAQYLLFSVLIVRIFFHWGLQLSGNVLYAAVFKVPILGTYTEGVLFLWLIMNISVNPQPLFSFKNRVLDFLGEISYGIYMYQSLIIFVVITLLKKPLMMLPFWASTALYLGAATGLTILVSFLSKKYFEDYFLKIKHRFDC